MSKFWDTVFRKLYAHVENGKPISKYLLDKFTWFGIYHPKENLIENPENEIGLILQAMTWQGLTSSKCPDGKIRNLSKWNEYQAIKPLLVKQKTLTQESST